MTGVRDHVSAGKWPVAASARSVRPRLPVPVAKAVLRIAGRRTLDAKKPWADQRSRLESMGVLGRLPRGTRVEPANLSGVPAERVTAAGSNPQRLVLHFHGGGYCVGTPALARGWAARLGRAAAVNVVLPDYRLAPEHPHPAALQDALGVWEAVVADYEPSRVVLSGDSAGGGLALALVCRLRDSAVPLPAGLILISPWLDLTADRSADPDLARRDRMLDPAWLDRCAGAYAAATPPTDPAISPLLGQLDRLPPTLVQVGSDDVLVSDSRRFAASASAAGVDVRCSIAPGLWHDFPLQAGVVSPADSSLRQAASFALEVSGD